MKKKKTLTDRGEAEHTDTAPIEHVCRELHPWSFHKSFQSQSESEQALKCTCSWMASCQPHEYNKGEEPQNSTVVNTVDTPDLAARREAR